MSPYAKEVTKERLDNMTLIEIIDLYAHKVKAIGTYDPTWDADKPRYLMLRKDEVVIRVYLSSILVDTRKVSVSRPVEAA